MERSQTGGQQVRADGRPRRAQDIGRTFIRARRPTCRARAHALAAAAAKGFIFSFLTHALPYLSDGTGCANGCESSLLGTASRESETRRTSDLDARLAQHRLAQQKCPPPPSVIRSTLLPITSRPISRSDQMLNPCKARDSATTCPHLRGACPHSSPAW